MRERAPRDEKIYIQAVEKINSSDNSWRLEYNFGPLMPQIAAIFSGATFRAETVLRTLNMLYSMAWLILMFFLCRDVFSSNNAGLLGMAIAAFNPYSARLSSEILRDPLYMLIFTLALWCAVKIIISNNQNMWLPVMLGLLTFLGFLSRYEGLEIAFFMPLAVAVLCLQYKCSRLKRHLGSLAAYGLTLGILICLLIYSGNDYALNTKNKICSYYHFLADGKVK
ncbi:MAG: glycosyltransferase family 39 protein [Victivallaceae bacterium]